jgi:hypothetical protein
MQLQNANDEQRRQITYLAESVCMAMEFTKKLPKFIDWNYIKVQSMDFFPKKI